MSRTEPTDAFLPPGPGGWDLDLTHYPGGTTPISQMLMGGCAAGIRKAFAEFGMAAETLDVRFVNGFMYSRLRPLIRPDKPAAKLPPIPLLKLVVRLHPQMRRRATVAARTMAERPWRAVVADWHATTRPRLETRNLELQDVDPGSLDDAALAQHLASLLTWLRETFTLHFYLHVFDLGPIGLLVYDAERWGLATDDVVRALEGASPSTSAPGELLAELRAELKSHGVAPTSLDGVRATSPYAAELLGAYLRRRGNLLVTRYDLDGQTLGERPDTVLASIVAAPAAGADHRRAEMLATELRAQVPDGERARFDERLAEARAAMDLRDDNGPCTAEWPLGLLRRALLVLGRRLVAEGRAERAEHVFELEPGEVDALARRREGPSGAALAARAVERQRLAQLDPPAHLGPVEPDPPMSVLAPAHQLMVGSVRAVLEHMGLGPSAAHAPLSGSGVGTATYRGVVRIAADPESALDRLEPGDVLVVRCTTPAYNTVLAIAGAVVTTEGGPLSHAAVMARELGIPAVIGAAGALHLPDGAVVDVDPVLGEVRVVS